MRKTITIAGLSQKQVRILKLICKDMSTKEIANELNISNRTVEAHRDKMRDTVGVKSVAGLVVYAIRQGIVPV
jgi:DNA-binding CsgD family transcriptional regulator